MAGTGRRARAPRVLGIKSVTSHVTTNYNSTSTGTVEGNC